MNSFFVCSSHGDQELARMLRDIADLLDSGALIFSDGCFQAIATPPSRNNPRPQIALRSTAILSVLVGDFA